jgi:hypothetical protein
VAQNTPETGSQFFIARPFAGCASRPRPLFQPMIFFQGRIIKQLFKAKSLFFKPFLL